MRKRCLHWMANTTRTTILNLAGGIAVIVLLINISLLIVALRNHEHSLKTSLLYKGDCDHVNRLGSILHFMINILSTILLGASNYATQILAAPTREDIDYAHSKSRWLDIGVPSLRNIRYISKLRKALFILLCLSSLPLHLVYNSAVFTAVSSNEHDIVVAYEEFLNSTGPYTHNFYYDSNLNDSMLETYAKAASQTPWKNLSIAECSKTYISPIIRSYSNVIFIADESSRNSSYNLSSGFVTSREIVGANLLILDYGYCIEHEETTSNGFRCDSHGNIQKIDISYYGKTDYIAKFPIKYCLAQPAVDRCQLSLSPEILIIVIIFNAIKAACLFLTACKYSSVDHALSTVGDAIKSFLEQPDNTVVGLCVARKRDFSHSTSKDTDLRGIIVSTKSSTKASWAQRRYDLVTGARKGREMVLYAGRPRWFTGASLSRWNSCIVSSIAALGWVAYMLHYALEPHDQGSYYYSKIITISSSEIWSRGIGQIYGDSILFLDSVTNSLTTNITSLVLVVNTPQLILSLLYVLCNSLFTSLLTNKEYTSYSAQRKGLRVSKPMANSPQRGTYYLQVPYRYGLPFMVISFTLHYMTSQALFIAYVVYYSPSGVIDTANSAPNIGYSVLAIIITMTIGSLAIMALFGIGFRRYNSFMPVGGTCSASIAAACWRPAKDIYAAQEMVQWGELVHQEENFEIGSRDGLEEVLKVPHLCFTSFDTIQPRAKIVYH